MKIKRLVCLITAGVIAISTFPSAVTALDYYDGTYSYTDAPETQIDSFTYILKTNVEYETTKFPYSATVTDVPDIQRVEIPDKVICNGIEFIVTDVDLNGKYTVTRNKKIITKNKYNKIEEIVLPDTIYNITEIAYLPNVKKMNIPENTVIGRYDYSGYEDYCFRRLYYDDLFFDKEFLYFAECPNIKLSVDQNNQHYIYKNDMLYSKDEKDLYMSFNKSSDIIIPDGTECIMNNGGLGFKHVKSIKLPDTLESIWGEVFRETKLTKLTLPDSLKELQEGVFIGSKIKKIKLGKNLISVGDRVFQNCNNLKSITLPKKVEIICQNAFKNCKKLKNVKILSSKVIIDSNAFAGCKNLKTVSINDLLEMNQNAFNKCNKLSKVIIKNKKTAPSIYKGVGKLKNPKKCITFCVKNKKVAKGLRKEVLKSKIKKAKILIGKRVVYNISKK